MDGNWRRSSGCGWARRLAAYGFGYLPLVVAGEGQQVGLVAVRVDDYRALAEHELRIRAGIARHLTCPAELSQLVAEVAHPPQRERATRDGLRAGVHAAGAEGVVPRVEEVRGVTLHVVGEVARTLAEDDETARVEPERVPRAQLLSHSRRIHRAPQRAYAKRAVGQGPLVIARDGEEVFHQPRARTIPD